MAKDFLVEIGTEELPPKALKTLVEAFHQNVIHGLTESELSFESSRLFATPRRLAVVVKNLIEQGPDKVIEIHGPPLQAAKDKEGNWTKAATGFAKKNGITPEDLIEADTPKGKRLTYKAKAKGKVAVECLGTIVEDALDKLPIPKRMRWGSNRYEFIRPVHWVVMLFGADVIPCNILGIPAGNQTRGHRFHCDTTLDVANPSIYEARLKDEGHVIASFTDRQEKIRGQVIAEGKKLGGTAVIDEDLLDEVTALVEWPVALTGSFEEKFLQVPQEALISSMKEHQKYFHVVDKQGNLLPNFITVANIQSQDSAQVIDGNERVIRPRLSDAAFFFETDKNIKLEDRIDKLQSVVFQAKLGTLLDKTKRVQKLARFIADSIGANGDLADRAAQLSKTDLVSDMVLEFDTMQGIAGRYYALNDGEANEVADAIRDQYLPKFSGDALPESKVSCALAVADRLDTLVGIFGIGQPPTGSKDPFALRRASLSVLRILVEKELSLDLQALLEQTKNNYADLPQADTVVQQVFDYMIERFRAWYADAWIPIPVFQAVSAKQVTVPLDFDQRVKAVHAFYQMPEAEALAAANKRVSNILAKHEGEVATSFDKGTLSEAAEKTLAAELSDKQQQVQPLFDAGNYKEGLAQLASLRTSVDDFFDNVMVMVDDEKLRNNRLALLNQLRALFLQVADISLLAGAKE